MPSRSVPAASSSPGLRLLGGAAGLLATAVGAKASEVVFTPPSPLTVSSNGSYAPFTFELTTGNLNSGSDPLSVNFVPPKPPASALIGQVGTSNNHYYDDSGTNYLTYGFATSALPTSGPYAKPTLTKYGTSAAIGSGSFAGRWTDASNPQASFDSSDWTAASSQGFIGLSYTPGVGATYYGWAEFAYDKPTDSLSLLSFGYNDTLNAGSVTPGSMTAFTAPIPEPATTALVGALLAGSAALYQRRRRATAA